MSKLAKDAISKNPIVFKVFLEKIFKLSLYHRISRIETTFMLMSLLNYCFAEKQSSEKNLIRPINFYDFEIIFIFLAKTIAIEI